MKILTIGDSHCEAGWNRINIPDVTINCEHIGPKLMYSFGKERWNLLNPLVLSDVIVFCFGEIDIRCHLFKRAITINDIQQEIDNLVSKYIMAIHTNIGHHQKIKPCVYFVPPTVKKGSVTEDIEYPFIGSDIARRIAVRYMNHRLSVSCKEKGFIFIDLYDSYCDKEGYLNKEMSDGSVHIGDTAPLISFIQKNLI